MAEQATDQRARVAVVAGGEPVGANENPAPVLSLKQRLAAIRDECSGIIKDDIKMGNFSIKGHTFEAILSEVPHAEKSAEEATARAKADRIHAKHFGYWPKSKTPLRTPPKTPLKSRGFDRAPGR